MSTDLDAIMARLVADAVEKIATRTFADLDRRVVRAVHRALDERQGDALQPLHRILGCSAAAARSRLRRDPELAKLGVVVSKYNVTGGKFAGAVAERIRFRPSDVNAYLAAMRISAR